MYFYQNFDKTLINMSYVVRDSNYIIILVKLSVRIYR